MAKVSAGILLYRHSAAGELEVFLVHPGGPFFASREAGVWSVPKGEYHVGEEPLEAAEREFAEETGFEVPVGERLDLGEVRQGGGKVVRAFAVAGDVDAAAIVSNECEIEFPPRSRRRLLIPEVDKAMWASPHVARKKLVAAQVELVDRLAALLAERRTP